MFGSAPESKDELRSNQRGIRRLEIALAIVSLSFYLLCLASASALADDRHVAAIAPLAPLKPEQRNGDYLNTGVAAHPPAEADLNSQIFDTTFSAEMKQKYGTYARDYEIRQAYRLNRPEDYLEYQRRTQDLVEWTIKRLLQYHFENTVKNQVEQGAKRAASNSKDPGTQAAASAVVTISKVQKAITNTTINLGQDTKTRFKYDFPSGVMRVGMTSPLVEATMDYRMKAADPAPGAVSQPEKLSLGVSRAFKDLGATSNARYGLVSETVNYGMNKHLVGPLSAQVDQVHNMRDTSKDETIGRLNFGLTF